MKKKPKILVLQGTPASGKSTYAKSLDPSKWKRINRDELRRMIGGNYSKEREKFVTSIEVRFVEECLLEGHNVVIDDTNLAPKTIKMWNDIAEEYDAAIEFKEIHIPMAEAIERDKDREFPVGKKVIMQFYKAYYPEEYKEYFTDARIATNTMDETKPDVLLCDLDGTIALHNGRDAFEYDKIDTDVPNVKLERLLASSSMPVIFLSGREGTPVAYSKTAEWLKNLGYGESRLFMRQEKDFRPDEVIKKELYETYIKPNYNVVAVFDDRNKVVKMWRELGLMCCQVNEGDF